MMPRRLLLLLSTLLLALGAPGSILADDDQYGGNSGDNAAIVYNREDNSSRFRFAYSLDREGGDVVDNENAAIAYASCENCRTTAIALQIVLVSSSPGTVTPKNYAIAVNEACTLCQTFATAFQFVVGVESRSVRFTDEGERELDRILREFRSLKRETYTLGEFHARTQALAERVRQVLKTQLTSERDDDDDVQLEQDTEGLSG